ncbi:hypothetical protein OLMES_4268 [Oleiphilus messinensis]|uniref:DUF1853 family protein n=1 Tax=Oleiphilus messinensis TaxID=141451 RepID=A0A1Y0IFX0_9GAMM|nr:DUF1853 family protein [Oleiphilus messinensis]ARU58283.1 hypothetical protein OLMES_4268 [Oleiphilus messinensis]
MTADHHEEMQARIANLNTPEVRHLAWALLSPSLINEAALSTRPWQDPNPDWTLNWLQGLDRDPTSLAIHLQQCKSHFLGSYFEALWAFFFHTHPDIRLLAHNLQIHAAGKTLGEFDFIIQDLGNKQIIHLELAVKFYLFARPAEANKLTASMHSHLWLGPNCIDRLDKKLTVLQERQLRLSSTKQGKKQLEALNLLPDETSCICKGYLFWPEQPPHITPATTPRSEPMQPMTTTWNEIFINSNHLTGTWVSLSEFYKQQFDHAPENPESSCWVLLKKPDWLGPAKITPDQDLEQNIPDRQTLRALLEHHVRGEQRPCLLAKLSNDISGTQLEKKRTFVVPDHWPWST